MSLAGRGRDSTADYLYQVKLLSALRSGDPARIHPFLTDIAQDGRGSSDGDADVAAAALHLAIRCASCDTVSLLLSHRAISPNSVHPPGSGTTALHVAASLARDDVVNLLLEQEGIDDTLRDRDGKTALEVAKGKETIKAIKDSRAFLTASYRSLLRTYILSPPTAPPPDALIKLLSSPRIRHVDLSYLDDSSGRTLLHESVRRKDLKHVELAVRAGADVFVRDRRGRMVYDGLNKDDRVRVFLRQFTNRDTSLIKSPSAEPPEMKGYLNKYTNVAKGYNTRWFVLQDGIFSYYRHQEDESVACRGSIAMKMAVLTVSPGHQGLRFEVHSSPTRGHNGVQKWYLKANHPVEASRWIQALQKSIEWSRKEAENGRGSAESEAYSVRPSSSTMGHSSGHSTRRKVDGFEVASTTSSAAGDEPVESKHAKHHSNEELQSDADNDEVSVPEAAEQVPHGKGFELQGNALVAQMELAAQMLGQMPAPPEVPPRAAELTRAVQDTVGGVNGMLREYVQMVREREEWWRMRLERERQRQQVWEESLQAVVREGDALERELRNRSRRRSRMMDSSFITVGTEGSTVRRRISQVVSTPTATTVFGTPETSPRTAVPSLPGLPSPTAGAGLPLAGLPMVTSPTATTTPPIGQREYPLARRSPSSALDDDMGDTDEEDEFFDAIESNTLPNLIINESLTSHPPSVLVIFDKEQYSGYLKLRDKLGITSDNRPPMSLWAVLKNSIGKDLTKISFPVFFNEPTSMLQRMAEDMEFSECLDAAFAEDHPHRRIAFVAAFAMSNYSSTIGRIAKPFNPMLGETFEYVRFDKEYRYVSEQVSHHPPISACWAESPMWRYYGEVDAQNKFLGKSFEIRPTGVAHVELLLPKERAPDYPKAVGYHEEGRVIEHYSWKKVTTNISGFILGSPTIDHYGDMTITNHRTGDKCVLTFKPRGWRGKDAYEISGYVMDADDNVTYEIAGRWNSQLVARAVGTGIGQLHPDVAVNGPASPTSKPEYILLWRNSLKPPAPFNLTPFALTLNDCPEDTMKPYICPTDCRLRPDQRAFELGKYERANDLKNKQEEFQRATRRARDEGRSPPHKPRWFSAETEPDTGERVWRPHTLDDRVEYWVEREKVWRAEKSGVDATWSGVDHIFIEDEP
ncbi:hypothetical protein OBBRIDRAFT_793900 [Obba rivulosa]|uniref:PH domain-containing protein n=1 Tax=Obba rivulosa TaxID=1052685 RepID=A0A8E2AWZ1_9APHY|nr:hypothetical protein OBBRIDRAFT_793900 [Obba rivulosa]